MAQTDPEGRLGRLERAVVDFDSATITTIHGFAQQFLSTLGSAASGDLDATLLDDTAELLQAVCADVLAAESLAHSEIVTPLPTLKDLSDMATKVLGNPGIRSFPTPTTPRWSLPWPGFAASSTAPWRRSTAGVAQRARSRSTTC